MTRVAMAIVLASALLHAGWNLLAKKSHRKIVFIWWFLLVGAVLFFPMFLYFWPKTTMTPAGWGFAFTSGFIHVLYFFSLVALTSVVTSLWSILFQGP